MDWLCGSLVCLDAHLPRPGWRGEDLGLPTGQGTLTALRTGEGRGEGVGGVGGCWGGRKWKLLYFNKLKKTIYPFCLNKKEGFNFNIVKLHITKQVSSKNYSYNIYIYFILS